MVEPLKGNSWQTSTPRVMFGMVVALLKVELP